MIEVIKKKTIEELTQAGDRQRLRGGGLWGGGAAVPGGGCHRQDRQRQ